MTQFLPVPETVIKIVQSPITKEFLFYKIKRANICKLTA